MLERIIDDYIVRQQMANNLHLPIHNRRNVNNRYNKYLLFIILFVIILIIIYTNYLYIKNGSTSIQIINGLDFGQLCDSNKQCKTNICKNNMCWLN